MLDSQQTVANLVLDHSECAEVLQRHRIDFCCRGHMTLAEAADSKHVSLDSLLNELSGAISARGGLPEEDPRALPTPRLISHIVAKHHRYLRGALPFIVALAQKVSRVHGGNNPKLRDIESAVLELSSSLLAHLDEEEQTLFPALQLERPDAAAIQSLNGSMLEDHLALGGLLERIRSSADDFTLPVWACNSYRTLFAELEQLERDTFAHIHLENHVLAPRFAPQLRAQSTCQCSCSGGHDD